MQNWFTNHLILTLIGVHLHFKTGKDTFGSTIWSLHKNGLQSSPCVPAPFCRSQFPVEGDYLWLPMPIVIAFHLQLLKNPFIVFCWPQQLYQRLCSTGISGRYNWKTDKIYWIFVMLWTMNRGKNIFNGQILLLLWSFPPLPPPTETDQKLTPTLLNNYWISFSHSVYCQHNSTWCYN